MTDQNQQSKTPPLLDRIIYFTSAVFSLIALIISIYSATLAHEQLLVDNLPNFTLKIFTPNVADTFLSLCSSNEKVPFQILDIYVSSTSTNERAVPIATAPYDLSKRVILVPSIGDKGDILSGCLNYQAQGPNNVYMRSNSAFNVNVLGKNFITSECYLTTFTATYAGATTSTNQTNYNYGIDDIAQHSCD